MFVIKKEWSYITLIVYLIMALLMAFLFKKAIQSKNNKETIKFKKWNLKIKYLYYILIYLIFILFSCYRYIGVYVGGADVPNYVKYFYNLGYVNFDLKKTLIFNGYEYLFYNTMYLIRIIGGNFRTFLIFENSVMIISLIYFVDKNIEEEKKCYWLTLAFLPLLKGFNIIRNCVSAFFCYLSMSKLNENKYLISIVLALIAYLNHYVAIVVLALIIFYKYLPDDILKNKKLMVILNILSIIISCISLPLLKIILANTGYCGYVAKIDVSLWGYIPYMLIYFLMILDNGVKDYLIAIKHEGYYKIIYFLSLMLPFFIILNAANRVLLLFDLPIIIIAMDISKYYTKYIPKKYINLYNVLIFFLVVSYFLFRIYRIWDGYCIMPYHNVLFQ